jgi:hypothetical protein
MTRLDELHVSISDWFVQRGGKVDNTRNDDFKLTEIKTTSWTVFIGPDSWGEEAYDLQTKNLEVAILIDPCIDLSRFEEGEFRILVEEMQNQINEDSVTLMPNYPDGNALWLARSIYVDQTESTDLDPILKHLSSWADAAYAKFATWPNIPRFKLIDGGKLH